MTSHIRQDAGRSASAEPTKKAAYPLCAGIAAALLLSCSPAALHAETSNAELAKEIAELKAQIRDLRGSVTATRVETRREVQKVKAVASRTPIAPAPAFAYPEGAVPAFVTADKKLVFGGITITPGGFAEGASIYRSRATQSDLQSNFNGSPFDNTVAGHTQEFKFSARQTRAALLIEGAVSPSLLVSGYGELDFLGAASTANYNQTDGFQPRIRNLYAAIDSSEYGMHVLAGQSWSLLTLNSKGITPRNEVTPAVIDASQVVGSLYARQPGIRLVKDFNKKLWLGVSVEESQTSGCPVPPNTAAVAAGGAAQTATVTNGTNGTQALPGGITAVCDTTGTGGSFTSAANGGTNFSFNHLPDVIGKAVYEARFADRDIHFEAEGVVTNLYDRVTPTTETVFNQSTATNKNTYGYGFGGGIIVPVIPKRLDFQANGLYGRGINRYGAGQLPESTFNSDGSLRADQGYIALTGLTFHATPSIDLYGYAGIEGVARAYTQGSAINAAGTVGIGAQSTNDTGCYIEGGTCNGSTRRLFELTGGFWDKIYKGSFGEVRAGANYAYINRQLYNANVSVATSSQPKTSESIIETSLRYYPFQ